METKFGICRVSYQRFQARLNENLLRVLSDTRVTRLLSDTGGEILSLP